MSLMCCVTRDKGGTGRSRNGSTPYVYISGGMCSPLLEKASVNSEQNI